MCWRAEAIYRPPQCSTVAKHSGRPVQHAAQIHEFAQTWAATGRSPEAEGEAEAEAEEAETAEESEDASEDDEEENERDPDGATRTPTGSGDGGRELG